MGSSARHISLTLGPLSRELRLAAIILCALAAAPIAVSFIVSPQEMERGEVKWLPSAERWHHDGKPCVLCGATRSFCAMSHGDWTAAVRYNSAGPVLYGLSWAAALFAAFALAAICRSALRRLRRRRRCATGKEGLAWAARR